MGVASGPEFFSWEVDNYLQVLYTEILNSASNIW